MCPPNPARFLLRFRGCVALSRAVAPAVADRVAEQRVQKPCKIKAVAVLRFHRGDGGCAASGNLGPHLIETTARPFRPHPQHRKRGSRLRRLVVGTPYLV